MMQVGAPSTPDANALTTKPRQMPSGGGGGDGVPPGGDEDSADTPFGTGDFEPDSNGANIVEEREENSDTSDDAGDDAAVNAEPQAPAAPKEPATTKPSPVVAKVMEMVRDAMDTNPGLDPREAVQVASEAMLLTAEYHYDPGMHHSDFATGPSLFNRYLRDMHKLLPDSHMQPDHPMRPTAFEEGVKDFGQQIKNKIKQKFAPKQPPAPEAPEAPDEPTPAEPAPPKTMGEMHRRTMEQFPSTAKDLWHQRFDPRPYNPEGYPESDAYDPNKGDAW